MQTPSASTDTRRTGPVSARPPNSNNIGLPALYVDTEGSNTPEILAINDNTSTHVMSLDSSGNMILLGNLTVDGTIATSSYTSCTTCAPPLLARGAQLETTGGGQIASGRAFVRLDPAFASQLDPSQTYRVFVMPDGDTNGLYVESKSRDGFTVREIHNGKSTLAFDYRVVGTARPVKLQRPIGTLLANRAGLDARGRRMTP